MKTDSRWTLATGEDGGKPLIFRIRIQAPLFASKSSFPHLLAVCWNYESPNEQGMPDPADAQRMSELEDLLEEGLEGVCQAFLTVIVTGNGVREWQWYARDTDVIIDLVNKTLGHLEPFPIELSFQDDPEWEGYSQFLAIIGSET
jgi:hypothetical protein